MSITSSESFQRESSLGRRARLGLYSVLAVVVAWTLGFAARSTLEQITPPVTPPATPAQTEIVDTGAVIELSL